MFLLTGPIPAGNWHLVGDTIVVNSVDVTYDVLWRNGAGDHPLASFTHHFEPLPSGFNAQPYEDNALAAAAPAKSNDQLVLRFSAQGSSTQLLMIPNSDGVRAMGRIPSLTLPK
jgi:hypothetical protein